MCSDTFRYFVLRVTQIGQEIREVRVKVKVTLEQATKAQRGVELQLYSFFNLSARWSGWLTPRPSRFTSGKDPVPIVKEVGWAPGGGLEGCGKSRPYRDSIPGPSSTQRVAIPTELSRPAEMWEVRIEIILRPFVKCDFHYVDFHQLRNRSVEFCWQYRTACKSDGEKNVENTGKISFMAFKSSAAFHYTDFHEA